jgi:hypothetical protein
MKIPALLMSVSTRPNLARACSMTRCAVAGSAMSPATVSTPGSSDAVMEREFATTAHARLR